MPISAKLLLTASLLGIGSFYLTLGNHDGGPLQSQDLPTKIFAVFTLFCFLVIVVSGLWLIWTA